MNIEHIVFGIATFWPVNYVTNLAPKNEKSAIGDFTESIK